MAKKAKKLEVTRSALDAAGVLAEDTLKLAGEMGGKPCVAEVQGRVGGKPCGTSSVRMFAKLGGTPCGRG
jgi:hypothetical protein